MSFGTTFPNYTQPSKVIPLWNAWQAYSKKLTLTPSQDRFVQAFFTGGNCLLTGEAGTGKSYLTKALVAFLQAHRVNVGITALTGVAAFGVGGQTLHSFCGVGLADEPVANLLVRVFKNRKAKSRIEAVDVLFVDEISMARGDLLNKIDAVLRSVRKDDRSFGGIQLCFVSDFLQLPPVFRENETRELAFQCEAWKAANIQTVVLKEQMRQVGDPTLLKVLSCVRIGDTKHLHLLDSRVGATFPNDGIEAVRIFCHNHNVDSYNGERLSAIAGQVKSFTSQDDGLPQHIEQFNKNCPAPQVLELKVGAQVMLLVNIDTQAGLVNGSIGVVRGFNPDGVSVKFKDCSITVDRFTWEIKEQIVSADKSIKFVTVATRCQIPLKVCYAVTVHKVQGCTLDRAVVDVNEAFAEGQVYCALSRVRNMESLSISSKIRHSAIRVNADCVEFYRQIDNP